MKAFCISFLSVCVFTTTSCSPTTCVEPPLAAYIDDHTLQASLDRLIERKQGLDDELLHRPHITNTQCPCSKESENRDDEQRHHSSSGGGQHPHVQCPSWYSGHTVIIASLCSFITGINVAIFLSRIFNFMESVQPINRAAHGVGDRHHTSFYDNISDEDSIANSGSPRIRCPRTAEDVETSDTSQILHKAELQLQLKKLKLEIEKKMGKLNSSPRDVGQREQNNINGYYSVLDESDNMTLGMQRRPRKRQYSTGHLHDTLSPTLSFDNRPQSASSNDILLLKKNAQTEEEARNANRDTIVFADDADVLSIPSGDEEGATAREARELQAQHQNMRRAVTPGTRKKQNEYSNKCRALFTELRDSLALSVEQSENGENINVHEDASENVALCVLAIRDLFEELSTLFDNASSRVTAMILCCNIVLEHEGLDALQASKKIAVNTADVAQKIIETLVPHIWGM